MGHIGQLLRASVKQADKKTLNDWFNRQNAIELPTIGSTAERQASDFQKTLIAFNAMHDWQHEYLHPCFPQMLGLTQHINALLDPASPFPLMGLVHVNNQVTVTERLRNDNITITCRFADIAVHEKGITVDIDIDVSQNQRLCQSARSTYLYRMKTATSDVAVASGQHGAVTLDERHMTDEHVLRFHEDVGRRYARVSGDFNPIHLYAWSAKLFGFKTAIAHGMHVLAKIVSTLDTSSSLLASPCTLTNTFRYPVPLPSELSLRSAVSTSGSEHEQMFELINPSAPKRKQVVVSGSVSPR